MHVCQFFFYYPFLAPHLSHRTKNNEVEWSELMHGDSPRYMLKLAKELGVFDWYPIDDAGIPIKFDSPWYDMEDLAHVDLVGLRPASEPGTDETVTDS